MSAGGNEVLKPGTVLTTAVLSPCVGGLVRTWTDAGSHLWSLEDPAALRGLMGHGALARSPVGPDRFREAALLDAESGTLVLQPRFASSTDDDGMTVEAQVVALRPAGDADEESMPEEFLQYLQVAVRHCEESGEILVLEEGANTESPNRPYCLWALQHHDGETLSVLETSPIPVGSALWAAPQSPKDEGVTMTAPASPEVITAVRFLLAEAMATWDLEPWDTALTFWRPSADG